MFTFSSIDGAIQQNHESCCSPVLWQRLWLSRLLNYHLLEYFDSVLARTIETQHCQVFPSHFLLIFVFLLEQLSSKGLKYFSLFSIQVDIVLVGSPYFLAASLLDRPFSMPLSALHFSFSVFTKSFHFNILKSTTPESQRKNLKECLFLL